MSRHPEVLWAQRSDKVYLTVALPDAKDVFVKCEPQGLFAFSASGVQDKAYSFSLELYGSIEPEKGEKGWWKRLLKSEEKPAPYLKLIWYLMMMLSLLVKMTEAVMMKECCIFLIWKRLGHSSSYCTERFRKHG
ncbi:co-chaperone protein p23-2-like isoform X4 [Glycine soja]|uniref:co-chaperone protein p23-2-like isoform X4 n=1 Tax=Glycine soja TaxID=3848 RepID=UPI000E21B3CF|nr:co-chaperone protein p23-2-like isoform X4 [Glycine soja]|eukprot:XP_025984153.1 uncharacterized protein LOC100527476 isoform X4 [Glycine max]